MMLYFHCPDCKLHIVVNPMDKEVHLLKRYMRCPNADTCKGKLRKMLKQSPPEAARKLTALELFQATEGFGFPGEKNCTPQDLRKVMVRATVVAVELEQVGGHNRSIITSLKLSTGHTLHFAGSALGSTIYKVTKDA
jgi:hypothetical protein